MTTFREDFDFFHIAVNTVSLVIAHMSERPPRFHSLQQNSLHFALDTRCFDTSLAQNLGGLRWQ